MTALAARLHRFQPASRQNAIAKTRCKPLRTPYKTIRIHHLGLYPVSSKNIMHAMAQADFVEAVKCLVKDPDKKYDEVLVDRFADVIKLELSSRHKDWQQTSQILIDTLQSLIDDKSFVMFDQARAFKLLRAVVDSKVMNRKEFEGLQPLLDSFWWVVPNVVVNNNSPAATVMLDILKILWKTRFAHDWLIGRRIKPSLKINKETVSDIASLARFYMKNANNYHTRNRAEELFQELLSASYIMNLAPSHHLVQDLLETVRELLLEGSDTMVTVIMKLLSQLDAKSFCTKYGLSDMVQECFEAMVRKPKCNFITLSKCVSLSGRRKFLFSNIELLKDNNRIEALIVYLIWRPHYWEHCDLNQFVETYLMYPILSTCPSSDSKHIISKLDLNALDTQRIDKCNHPRLVLHCLIHLNQLLQNKKLIDSQLKPSTLSMIVKMVENFVAAHLNSIKYYKSIIISATTLRLLFDLPYSEERDRFQKAEEIEHDVYYGLLSIFTTIEKHYSESRKPVLISFLSVMRFIHEKASGIVILNLRRDKSEEIMYEELAHMAFKYDDEEIIEEFAYFFLEKNDSLCIWNYLQWMPKLYFRLLWEWLLPNLRKSEICSRSLGNLLVVLFIIEEHILEGFITKSDLNIENIDTFRLVGDILIEKATNYSVIEPVIHHLYKTRYLYKMILKDKSRSDEHCNESDLDNWTLDPKLPPIDEKSFNRFTLGFCSSIWKAELGELECSQGVEVMFKLAKIIVKTSTSTRRALSRLLKAGVLATVHGIASTSSYSERICQTANKIAHYIGLNVRIENMEDCIFDELKLFHDDNPDVEKLQRRAKRLAEFYYEASMMVLVDEEKFAKHELDDTSTEDNIILMVQNFLNYPDYDNTMDCH